MIPVDYGCASSSTCIHAFNVFDILKILSTLLSMQKLAEVWSALSKSGKKVSPRRFTSLLRCRNAHVFCVRHSEQKYEDMAEADRQRSAKGREKRPKINKVSEPKASSRTKKGTTLNFPHPSDCFGLLKTLLCRYTEILGVSPRNVGGLDMDDGQATAKQGLDVDLDLFVRQNRSVQPTSTTLVMTTNQRRQFSGRGQNSSAAMVRVRRKSRTGRVWKPVKSL